MPRTDRIIKRAVAARRRFSLRDVSLDTRSLQQYVRGTRLEETFTGHLLPISMSTARR